MIVVVIPSVLLAIVSLASFAGRWVWWLDVLANFRAQYVAVLLFLGLILLVSRWRRTGAGILAVAVINLVYVAPLYLGSAGESSPEAPGLRVLSFNLLSSNESYGPVIDYIGRVDPDLVFLYEASRPWEIAIGSAGLDYEMITARSDDLTFGTIVLARDEVDAVSYGFAIGQPRAVALDYRPAIWPSPVRVLSTHPLAPTTRERADLRDAQLQFATGWASGSEGPTIVVGDLNATPWSWPFRRLVAETGLRSSQIGFGLQPTFPTTSIVWFQVPIDHLLHNESLRVRDRRLGPDLGSDHLPLVVDLELVRDP